MAEGYIDLSPIINAVQVVNSNLGIVSERVGGLERNIADVCTQVDNVYTQVDNLAQAFFAFVVKDERDKQLQRSMTDIIRIRQELEKKFGYYDEVRRRATGILQAVDISVVRKETIASCTEELMLSAPRYWLAPCLIALSAWINNDQVLADKAINEALKRDDEKSSLLFSLIGRRANRYNASEVWLERYFSMQDPSTLERESIIVIDAFANGLFGADSRGSCSKQIKSWIAELSQKAGFVEDQHKQWKDAILSKVAGVNTDKYPYLQKHSDTWGQLKACLPEAYLHQRIGDFFKNIFECEVKPSNNLNAAVDTLLDNLVTNFDSEELPLRREERLTSLIIEEQGEKSVAEQRYAREEKALAEHFSFTQLLTNAAMHPETSHSSIGTQRFAIALSKDWIVDAYEDITATCRQKIPASVKIKIESWSGETKDGSNEEELSKSLGQKMESLRDDAVEKEQLTAGNWFVLIAGIALLIAGIAYSSNIVLILLGFGGIGWFAMSFFGLSKKKEYIRKTYDALGKDCIKILKAVLAEVVDYRREYAREDAKSEEVLSYLKAITPQQFISSTFSTTRQIAN